MAAAPLYFDGTPLFWNNHSLFHYAGAAKHETIEDALGGISEAFQGLSKNNVRMTPKAGIVLAQMFDAAIETGYFILGETRPHDPTLPFDLAVNAEAISLLMQLFLNSTSPKPSTSTEKKS
jgi:hypothetical protein